MRRRIIKAGLPFRAGIALFALILFNFGPPEARADYINLTGAEKGRNIAEIHVGDDRVRVVLEVFVAFLQAYIFAMLTSVFVGLIKHAH